MKFADDARVERNAGEEQLTFESVTEVVSKPAKYTKVKPEPIKRSVSVRKSPLGLQKRMGKELARRADPGICDHKMALKKGVFSFYNLAEIALGLLLMCLQKSE
ncbi:hypothetical protein BTVI_103416 [Pitangus sulphuratus]|nr:hypothetical protein BTVI_103416 [Pitangus sulphuratus]